jgi:hypothetical protein
MENPWTSAIIWENGAKTVEIASRSILRCLAVATAHLFDSVVFNQYDAIDCINRRHPDANRHWQSAPEMRVPARGVK